MKIKEAIEFIEFELGRYRNPDFVMDKEDIKNKNIMEGIISLLQQGEKNKQILEGVKYELNWHKSDLKEGFGITKDDEILDSIFDWINSYEQKYLKEANPDEADNR